MIFENIFLKSLSLTYFQKFSHSKISTYTVLQFKKLKGSRDRLHNNIKVRKQAKLAS